MSTDADHSAKDQVDRAVLAALRQHADAGAGATNDEDDDALIAAVVAGHVQAVQHKRTRKTMAIVVTGLLAAAASWMLFSTPSQRDTTRADNRTVSQALWMLEPGGTPLEGIVVAADVETCGARRDARACLTPGSRAAFERDGNLQLHEGSARVEATGPISVFLAGVRVQASTDAADFIATLRAKAWVVSVERGMVTLTHPDGASEVVEAGEVAQRQPPEVAALVPGPAQPSEPEVAPPGPTEQNRKPTTASASADALLELARSQRAAREFEAAARTYEELIRAYPSSAKARATHVSLAQLYQGPLEDPANALVHFDRYLERGGPLAEEAHYGKIKALRALGRSAAAQAEIDAFLQTYPESVHGDALRGD